MFIIIQDWNKHARSPSSVLMQEVQQEPMKLWVSEVSEISLILNFLATFYICRYEGGENCILCNSDQVLEQTHAITDETWIQNIF